MKRVALAAPLLWLAGCASYYNAPGPAADMSVFSSSLSEQGQMTDAMVAARMNARPAASLPTALAIAHVQGPGYSSYGGCGYGSGHYSVVTTLDAERPEDIDRLRKLPMVRDVCMMNRLVLPAQLNSDLDLRAAAGAMHADMLLVYTFDTTFSGGNFAAPLSVVTLGLFPSRVEEVVTTASAVLLDTRTGYIFGVASGMSKQSQLANSWTSEQAAEDARLRAEREALDEILTGIEQLWPKLINDSPNWRTGAAVQDSQWTTTRSVTPRPVGNRYTTSPNP